MENQQFVEELKRRFNAYYDVYAPKVFGEREYDLYAHYFERNERYVASRKVVIYGIEQNEHVLYRYIDSDTVTEEDVAAFASELEALVPQLVHPSSEHMASLVVGCLGVKGAATKEAENFVRKYKYYKSFRFGFHGWVNIALVLVDVHGTSKLISNRAGRKAKKKFHL
ncbi:MAG: hypothetical protein Q4E76_02380 [Tissierellia bacterium]|nr:hypothetical protein [Tissierellia bacterium]